MRIVGNKILEFKDKRLYIGDKVIIQRTGLPEISGTIEALSKSSSGDSLWLKTKCNLAHIKLSEITDVHK